MGRFLSLLLWAGEKAVDVGVKPDVECFLKAWRGIPISEDGKKEQRRMQQRVYEARRRAKKVKISV